MVKTRFRQLVKTRRAGRLCAPCKRHRGRARERPGQVGLGRMRPAPNAGQGRLCGGAAARTPPRRVPQQPQRARHWAGSCKNQSAAVAEPAPGRLKQETVCGSRGRRAVRAEDAARLGHLRVAEPASKPPGPGRRLLPCGRGRPL